MSSGVAAISRLIISKTRAGLLPSSGGVPEGRQRGLYWGSLGLLHHQSPQCFDLVSHSLKPRLHLFNHRKTLLQIVIVLLDLFEMHLFLFFQPLLSLHFFKELLLSQFHPLLFVRRRHHHLLILGKVLCRHDWRSLSALIMSLLGVVPPCKVGGGPTPAPGRPRGGTIRGCHSPWAAHCLEPP